MTINKKAQRTAFDAWIATTNLADIKGPLHSEIFVGWQAALESQAPLLKQEEISDELQIIRLAKQMEANYNEEHGPDAIRPDFMASARNQLSDEPRSLTGLTQAQLYAAIDAIHNMDKPSQEMTREEAIEIMVGKDKLAVLTYVALNLYDALTTHCKLVRKSPKNIPYEDGSPSREWE